MYTVSFVERLLKNYLDIRNHLDGSAVPLRTSMLTSSKPVQAVRERPFGFRAGDESWPFMDVPHAVQPIDGKRRARQIEDLHCAIIDLERAISKLNPRNYALIRAYYIEGGRTLHELCAEFGYKDPSNLGVTCRRILQRLVLIMEYKLYDD